MPRKKIILSLDTSIDNALRKIPGIVGMSAALTHPTDADPSNEERISVGVEFKVSSPTYLSVTYTIRSPPPDYALVGPSQCLSAAKDPRSVTISPHHRQPESPAG